MDTVQPRATIHPRVDQYATPLQPPGLKNDPPAAQQPVQQQSDGMGTYILIAVLIVLIIIIVVWVIMFRSPDTKEEEEDIKSKIRKHPEASPERDMLIARIRELEANQHHQQFQQQQQQQQPQQPQQQQMQQQQPQQQKPNLERINQVRDEDLDAVLETINTPKKVREIEAIYEETLLQADKTLPYKSPDTVMTVSPVRVSNGEKDLQERDSQEDPSPKITKRQQSPVKDEKSEGRDRPITNLETVD